MKSVENAEKNPKAIDNWIESISELHRCKPPATVHYSRWATVSAEHQVRGWQRPGALSRMIKMSLRGRSAEFQGSCVRVQDAVSLFALLFPFVPQNNSNSSHMQHPTSCNQCSVKRRSGQVKGVKTYSLPRPGLSLSSCSTPFCPDFQFIAAQPHSKGSDGSSTFLSTN